MDEIVTCIHQWLHYGMTANENIGTAVLSVLHHSTHADISVCVLADTLNIKIAILIGFVLETFAAA